MTPEFTIDRDIREEKTIRQGARWGSGGVRIEGKMGKMGKAFFAKR